MLKLIKWLGGFALTLIILLALAIFIIPKVFDPNEYRDDITGLVKDQLDRELSLEGDLSVSVFPWLGIRTQGLSLSQPEEIGGDMLAVKNAQLRIKLLPLLSKKVEVDTVILEEPLVRIITLKNGLDSFSGLTGDDQEEEVSSDASAAVALAIQGVELTNGTVIIEDRAEDQRYEIADLNLITGNLIGTKLADIDISGVLKDSTNPDEAEFEVKGLARLDTDTLAAQLESLVVKLIQGDNEVDLTLGDLSVNQAQQIQGSDLEISLAGAQSIEVRVPSFVADIEQQVARLDTATISAGELEAVLSDLQATQFIDAPKATGSITVEPFDAATLIKDFQIDFTPTDPQALKQLGLSATFSGSLDGAELNNIKFTLDDSSVVGSASVKDFENPEIKFDLALDSLNLDGYLPESEEEEDESVDGAEALVVPLAVFKDVNANGRFKANTLSSAGLRLTDLDVVVASKSGSVSITPKANLYDGVFGGVINFSDKQDQSELRIKHNIDLVDLGKLLNAADVSDQLSGIGSLAIDVLVVDKDGVQSNKGTIELLAKDGAVEGVDVEKIITKAYGFVKSLSGDDQTASDEQIDEVPSEEGDVTKFAELTGTFLLNDFLVTNNDLSIKAPAFSVSGAGEIDLAKESINYLAKVAVEKNLDGQAGEALEKLKGLTIPVRCTGSFESPSCLPDGKQLYKLFVKSKIDQKKSEYLQEKLGIEDGEELSTKDVLKQLLLNKATKGDEKGQAVERPVEDVGRPQQNLEAEPQQGDSQETVYPQEDERSTKDQLKDDLKKKLLDSIFN